MTSWTTASSLATGAGTPALAIATFASVRSANRAARVAEQALVVDVRPLLMPPRLDEPKQEIFLQRAALERGPGPIRASARYGRAGWSWEMMGRRTGTARRDGFMLQVYGFDRISVVLGDIYFIDPNPGKGQEGPERGVRLEVRMLQPGELTGSIYSSRPITLAEPVWRADLLESADGPPGSLNRAHHHPGMRGWEPGKRVFERALNSDPVGWVGSMLSDLESLLGLAGVEVDSVLAADAERLRGAVPDVQRAVSTMLDQVKAGELGTPADDADLTSARVGWL